ncbi:MAG: PAS domain-containing protein [Alphaproteobacteria bacterium]|nr:MAG: PAS domain-containing protein [Alphaproteobacteria bacterium]
MIPYTWSSFWLWLVVGLVLAAWLGLTLYALWRAGRMTDRAHSLQDLADFLDSMIRTDHRHPVWLWADGRLQADAGTLALAGSPMANRLTDLGLPTGDLPGQIIEEIRAGLEKGGDVKTPLVVERGQGRPRLIIDIQWLPVRHDRWPGCILWLEESLDRPTRTNRLGVRALELRLKDLTRVFNSVPFPVWVRGPDYAIIEVNQAYVDAVDGESAIDTIERGLELFDRGSLAAARKARESKGRVRERRFGVIDGQRRAFSITYLPLDDEGNIMGIAVDVTGEEEALNELSRVLEAQSETLNRLRSPVAIFGPGQTLRFYNSAFARLSHISEDLLSSEIRHGELLDAMRERRRLPEQIDFPAWKKSVLRHYTSLLEPFEEMWHLPDGTAHRVVTQPHPLGGLLILFEDVTDRLALERSYNTLIAVQQETLDNMRESIAVFGTNGRLQLSNPAFQGLWKLSDAVLDGNPHLADLVKKMPAKPDLASGKRKADVKADIVNWVAARAHKTGRWYRQDGMVVDFAVVPLPDGGVMLTQSDVTDSFKVEQALRERSSALEAADRLKSEFITNMSYELRTPLNSIIGFTELLDQKIFGDLNSQQAAYVKDILSAAGSLKDLVADVLELAVIDAGEARLELEEVEVESALKDAGTLAQELARKVDVKLKISCPVPVGAIQADERRMRQAFYNMVSSMLNFGRYGGELEITLTGTRRDVTVAISNADSGLTPRERDRLVDTVAMGASPGGRRATGLDLALVRSIVGLHHGSVRLDPFEVEGLLLSLTLPRRQPAVIDTAAK